MPSEKEVLEIAVQELLEIFEIYAPPVPIELMLNEPPSEMWETVDPTQLSSSFLSVRERYSPRMSISRLLARHIAVSPWAEKRGITHLLNSSEKINLFARMLIMPADMIERLNSSGRNPTTMSFHFEVPEEDARQRLLDLL